MLGNYPRAVHMLGFHSIKCLIQSPVIFPFLAQEILSYTLLISCLFSICSVSFFLCILINPCMCWNLNSVSCILGVAVVSRHSLSGHSPTLCILPGTFLPGLVGHYSEYLLICLSLTACQALPAFLHGWLRVYISWLLALAGDLLSGDSAYKLILQPVWLSLTPLLEMLPPRSAYQNESPWTQTVDRTKDNFTVFSAHS